MATQQNFSDDEEEKNGQANQNGEQVLSNPSSDSDQTGNTGAPQNNQAEQTKSGSWTNLLDYVGANQGNDAQMGQKIGGGIADRANAAQTAGQNYQNKANQNIQSGTINDNGVTDAVKTNAKDVAANQKDQFDKEWNAYYAGPNQASDVEGYGATGQQYKGVQDRAQNAQTHEGRKTLLNDEYNRPTYSSGEKTLDSFILGAGDQGKQALNDINQQYGNYGSNWDSVLNQVGSGIQQGKATTDQTRENLHKAVGDTTGGLENKFGDYQNQLDQEYAANQGKYNKAIHDSKNTAKYSADTGVDKNIANYLFGNGFDLSNLINANGQRKIGDVADNSDIDNYQALFNLSGNAGGKYQDFNKSGNSTDAFNVNQNLVKTAGQAQALQNQVAAQQKAVQAKRNQAMDSIGQGLVSFKPEERDQALKSLGISAEDYALGAQNGINPLDYLTKGKDVSLEDVMSSDQSNAWNPLLQSLGKYGFKGMGSYNPNALSDPYSFDSQGYADALSKLSPVQLEAFNKSRGGGVDNSNPSTWDDNAVPAVKKGPPEAQKSKSKADSVVKKKLKR